MMSFILGKKVLNIDIHIQCIDLDMGPFLTHYSVLQVNIVKTRKPSLTFSIV